MKERCHRVIAEHKVSNLYYRAAHRLFNKIKEKMTTQEKKLLIQQLATIIRGATPKYMTAKEASEFYGCSQKTLLNRSSLPEEHHRYIPSLRLKGGRKKYFETKVLNKIFN